ncbi:hypothetical protein T440DRAFT_30253 [Plenodomus tracheiphilus IPT5]|uniref:Uncharacterized protein n=1 Tax=Plenodomus tracheiphilus IPT5 TaxID=1408161 RepID=A0A6A7BED4_9PLEO|nr:hypothetical protein T440DRAFT_30253 [Plenodomus tracheiphilus IPT5]
MDEIAVMCVFAPTTAAMFLFVAARTRLAGCVMLRLQKVCRQINLAPASRASGSHSGVSFEAEGEWERRFVCIVTNHPTCCCAVDGIVVRNDCLFVCLFVCL